MPMCIGCRKFFDEDELDTTKRCTACMWLKRENDMKKKNLFGFTGHTDTKKSKWHGAISKEEVKKREKEKKKGKYSGWW